MIEVKRFSGVLNTDDLPENVTAPQHINAKNVRFYGGPNGLTAENIKGNYSIVNNNLPAGSNECIGVFFDSVKNRIIWFNWNSNGDNGIYNLDIETEAVTPIFICNTDSASDILNFSPNNPVHSVSIIYRTAGDGDLLYWTDGNNRPKYINLDTVSSLAPFNEWMLDAAKNAPLYAPTVFYTSNTNLTVNNLENKIFRFAYRFVYKNLEKSTISHISINPIAFQGFAPQLNNTINIIVETAYLDGSYGDIKAVEVLGQESIGANSYSDFFLIDTIPATSFSGSSYTYPFVNDSTYTFLPVSETDLRFSYLPDKANTLEVLNGNVLIYGGLTDGYNPIAQDDLNVYLYSGLSGGYANGAIGTILLDPQNVSISVGGIFFAGNSFSIDFKYDNGTLYNILFTYTFAVFQNLTQATQTLVTQLNNEFTTLGINAEVSASSVGNIVTVTSTNIAGTFSEFRNYVLAPAGPIQLQTATPWSSKYRWGLMYFDEKGKTNGVISYVNTNNDPLNSFDYTSPDYISKFRVPFMMATINHTPPTWATSFQWVRTPNQSLQDYIQLVTNDFQSDAEYFYFCIQNLYYLKEKSSAFIPSYEFKQGDRLKVIAQYDNTTGSIAGFATQFDYEIVGVEERTMNSPSAAGQFIKVRKPSIPPAYSGSYFFIQLYTPAVKSSPDTQLFYEFGYVYQIYEVGGARYHRGNQVNQTSITAASFIFFDGASYFHQRQFYLNVDDVNPDNVIGGYQIMSPSLNDFYNSTVNSDSRGWPIDPNAKQEYNSVLVRWGGKYQSGTNINQLNIFQPADFDEADRGKGDVRRFKFRDKILRVFQDRGTGQYGVYARFIQNNQGQSELVTTNEIITTNNIQYYQGVYGLSGYPTNLASSAAADYFVDVVTGRCVRLGRDGLTDLGLLYKGQYYLSQLAVPYNGTITRANGYTSKVMGYFDFFDNQYHAVLQGTISTLDIQSQTLSPNQKEYRIYLSGAAIEGDEITVTVEDNTGNTETFDYTCTEGQTALEVLNGLSNEFLTSQYFAANVVASSPYPHILITSLFDATFDVYTASIVYAPKNAYNFSFNETRNGFCSFYDYHPEWAVGANDIVYTWLNGDLYKHDNTTNYCQFYGDNKNAEITIVFNSALHSKKSWNSLMEIASAIWKVPNMYTNTFSYGTTRQVSNLGEAEFTLLEGNPSAAIKRDANSSGGKINGNFMKGNYLVVKFQKQNAQNLITLSEASARFTDSPLTVK